MIPFFYSYGTNRKIVGANSFDSVSRKLKLRLYLRIKSSRKFVRNIVSFVNFVGYIL